MKDYIINVSLTGPRHEAQLFSAIDRFAKAQATDGNDVLGDCDHSGIIVKTVRAQDLRAKQLIFQDPSLARAFHQYWLAQQYATN